uniref:Glycosyltransferase RgtA/B/C/D-like domain-containing protein n=1 Tax=candidate division WOR-3 bacterium TaxID=2052148 RepID=A0A7C4TBC4_UNCW3
MERKKWFIYLLSLIPILLYGRFILKFSINLPQQDDYGAILLFLIKIQNIQTLKDFISLLFSFNNEHRIFFCHIITLVYYHIFGDVNFKNLIIFGNFSLIGIVFLLFKSFKPKTNKFLYFLPIIFLLFQPLFRDTSLWALASLSNLSVLPFAFLTIYLLAEHKNFFISIPLAFLATFTNGNGILVFPVGLGILVYQKRFKELSMWFFFMLFAIVVYFYSFNIAPCAATPKSLIQLLGYFFAFLGSTVGFQTISYFAAPVLGIAVVITFIYFVKKRYFDANLTNFSFLLFLLATAFGASVFRSGFGMEQACWGRYRLISILIVIILYLSFTEIFCMVKNKKIFPFILFFSILFNILSFYRLERPMIMRYNSVVFWGVQQKVVSHKNPLPYEEWEEIDILSESVRRGIYSPTRMDFIETKDIKFGIDSLKVNADSIEISGWAYPIPEKNGENRIFIILRGSKKIYLFANQIERDRDALSSKRFYISRPIDDLKDDSYQLGFYIRRGDFRAVQYSERVVKIGTKK